jgi:hypothetical protein
MTFTRLDDGRAPYIGPAREVAVQDTNCGAPGRKSSPTLCWGVRLCLIQTQSVFIFGERHMNQPKAIFHALALAVALSLSTLAPAAEPAKLGAEFTPLGGEAAASKDGGIPAWQGNEPQETGWQPGQKRLNSWKFKDEKPLFSVDAGNVEKYASKLSPGQVAMIKQIAGYRMDIYPSHRTCGAPEFVAENTRKNIGFASMNADGWSIKDAYLPGVPFPAPTTGAQVMWNSKTRYRGLGMDYKNVITTVSPRKGSTEWIKAGSEATFYFPWGAKGRTQLSTIQPIEYFGYSLYSSPTALAGQALSLSVSMNEPTEVFYYFPGQRRVRRMPSYSYDAPQIGFENQYTMDEPFVFNGLLDRFDWKLSGKIEMYVPYNSFGAYDFSSKLEDVALQNFIEPGHRRYELHRVWVVEATVKAGSRHSAPKRTFYVDEDSWNLVVADDYDVQGKLWKVREAFLIPVYETGSCDAPAFVQHNLAEGRYVFDMHSAGAGKDMQWVVDPKGPRYKSSFYSAENLRAISDR